MTDQEKQILQSAQDEIRRVSQLLQQQQNEKSVKVLLNKINKSFVEDYQKMSDNFKVLIPLLKQIAEKGNVNKQIVEALKNIKIEPKVEGIKVTVPEIKIPKPNINVDVKAPDIKIPKISVSLPEKGIKTIGFAMFAKSILSALKGMFNANMFVFGNHVSNDNPMPVVLVDTKGNPYRAVGGGGMIGGGGGNAGQSSNAVFARNAINEASYDLAAAAYNKTTVHTEHYGLTGIFIQFTTAVSKTITLSITDGTTTIPFKEWASDTATSRVFLPDKNWKLPKGWEIKAEVTQAGSACSMNLILITN